MRISRSHGVESRQVFQWLGYLRYAALLVALFQAFRPVPDDMQGMAEACNAVLLYAGVGIGMSSLQDPTRTQNTVWRKVWEDPCKGGWMPGVLAMQALLSIALGLLGTVLAGSTVPAQLSLGLVAFGLGMIGLLKTAMEMRGHHRLDKRAATDEAAARKAGA